MRTASQRVGQLWRRVQHQLDGEAVAEVWLGCVAGELAGVYGAKYVTR